MFGGSSKGSTRGLVKVALEIKVRQVCICLEHQSLSSQQYAKGRVRLKRRQAESLRQIACRVGATLFLHSPEKLRFRCSHSLSVHSEQSGSMAVMCLAKEFRRRSSLRCI